MRSHLTNILGKFEPTLVGSGAFNEAQVSLILGLIAEAFKSGHLIGVSTFADLAAGEIESMRKEFAAAVVEGGEHLIESDTTVAAYFVCDNLAISIADALRDSMQNELQ